MVVQEQSGIESSYRDALLNIENVRLLRERARGDHLQRSVGGA
jgi:hypothetical protein